MPKFITPVELSVTADATYKDVDITTHVGGDAGNIALAIILFANTHASTAHDHSLRKNGSTDDRYLDGEDNGHTWQYIGVDGNDIFEAKFATSDLHIWLLGWFTLDEAKNFTNAVDLSITSGTADVFQDIDISGDTGGDTAVCAMLEVADEGTITSRRYGIRKNGSTDDRKADCFGNDLVGVLIGLDGNEVFEMAVESLEVNCYLVGYGTDNFTSITNGEEFSTGTTGSYVDVDFSGTVGAGKNGVICEFFPLDTFAEYLGALRNKDDSGFDSYLDVSDHGFPISGIDSSRVAQQKIQNTGMDLFLLGYFSSGVTTTAQALVVTGTATPTFGRTATYLRDLTVTGVAPATCVKVMELFRSLNATAVGVATLGAAQLVLIALNATAVAVATLSTTVCRVVSLVAGAAGIATLARLNTFKVSMTVITQAGLAFMANEIDATIVKGRAGWSQLFTNKRGGEGGLFRFRR